MRIYNHTQTPDMPSGTTRVNVCTDRHRCVYPSSQHLVPDTDPEITTAQVQPYPRRTRAAPFLSTFGHGLPLFEKSNVLVMYATSLLL